MFVFSNKTEMRSDRQLMLDIDKNTSCQPDERLTMILNEVKDKVSKEAVSKLHKEWDFNCEKRMFKTTGRTLHKENVFRPQQFHRVQQNINEVIFVFSGDGKQVENLWKLLQKQASDHKYSLKNAQYERTTGRESDDFMKKLSSLIVPNNAMVVIILPFEKSQTYANVKEFAFKKGWFCQAMLEKNLRARNPAAVVYGILTQLVAKTGGAPWSVSMDTYAQRCMM
jgi:hypothetical protein